MTTRRRYAGLSEVGSTLESLRQVVSEMKQSLEVYERQRGEVADSFVRVSDLVDMGVLSPAQYEAFSRGETLATTELGGGKLRLIASPTIFNFTSAGTPNPPSQSVQLTAVTTDLDGPLTWSATAYAADGTPQGAVSLNIAGSQAALAVGSFGGAEYVIVEVRQLGLYDRVTISRSREGADGAPGEAAITAVLSRKSMPIPTRQNGIPMSFAAANGMFRVFSGTTEVTDSVTFTSNPSGLIGTINAFNDVPVAGQPRGYYEVTGLLADVGTLTMTATYNGVSITDTFTVNKAYIGYEVVGSLPLTDNYLGRVVFLTADSKLYRWNNSTWTAEVPVGDLLGEISETNIANDSISSPKLKANSVTAGKIDADAVTAREVQVGSLTGDRIQAGSITAAQIATGTITAGSAIIADGAITNAKIGDLEVNSLKIQGAAVSTSKIAPNAITNQSYTNTSTVGVNSSLTYIVATALNYGNDGASFTLIRVDCEYEKSGIYPGEVQFYLRPYDNFIGAFVGPAEQISQPLIVWNTVTVGGGAAKDQLSVRFYVPSFVNKLITYYIYATHTSLDGACTLYGVDMIAQEFKR